MIVDQAAKLREMVRARTSRARVVAITSGKGGVGKTNMAIGYALACAQMGLKTVLVDVDLGLANVDILLDVHAKYNLAHVITGRKSVEDVLLKAPGGVWLLPGATGLSQLANLDKANQERLIKKLESLEQIADVLVIDTGAGISGNVVNFTLSADEVIVVTTPEPTAITDAYAMIKVLSRHEDLGEIKLLVNMADSRADAERVADSLAANCRRFLNIFVDKLGYIRRDPKVLAAVRRRKHFLLESPGCAASQCLRNVVMRSFGARSNSPRRQSVGFFHRVSALFRKG